MYRLEETGRADQADQAARAAPSWDRAHNCATLASAFLTTDN